MAIVECKALLHYYYWSNTSKVIPNRTLLDENKTKLEALEKLVKLPRYINVIDNSKDICWLRTTEFNLKQNVKLIKDNNIKFTFVVSRL